MKETASLLTGYGIDNTLNLAVALTAHALRIEQERDEVTSKYVKSQARLAVAEREVWKLREELGRMRRVAE